VTIRESQSGDRVDIEVRLPKRWGWSGGGHRSVRVVLQVPKSADLDVRTGDGSVDVAPVAGRLSISTGDGGITVDGLQGEIQLHTGDGSIRATGLGGQLRADTGDGGITLRVPEDLGAEIDADTGDGQIVLDKPLSVTGSVGRSSVKGTLGAGGQLVRIHTGDGTIRLQRL
jgi:DUF4097 and DUF4098 domain-containing protein YvlB